MDLQESAELPYISVRAREMIMAFRSAGALGLWETICGWAEEDVKNHRTKTSASMNRIIEDSKHEFNMLHLLLSIPSKLVEALILNTVGNWWKNDTSFRRMVENVGGGAGIYINTIVRDDGTFLSREELRTLRQMIGSYILGKPNDEEAISIDSILHPGNATKINTASGERLWISKNGATQKLKTALTFRMRSDLDPIGNTRQHQSPLMVGISAHTARRITDHNPDSGLKNSGGPWGLVLSCLKVMKIDYEIVAFPVLDILGVDQREVAEILVTFLAGSLVEQGGYNAVQAGGSPGKAKDSYDTEKRRVYLENPWYDSAFQAMKEELRWRRQFLTSMHSDPARFKPLREDLLQNALIIKRKAEDLDVLTTDLELATERFRAISETNEKIEKANNESVSNQIEFLNELNNWLSH